LRAHEQMLEEHNRGCNEKMTFKQEMQIYYERLRRDPQSIPFDALPYDYKVELSKARMAEYNEARRALFSAEELDLLENLRRNRLSPECDTPA
jgi:hypothetical protein